MGRTVLGGRVALDRRSLVIIAGDLLLIALVVGLGQLRHRGGIDDFLATTVEFGVAWMLGGILLGAFTVTAVDTPKLAAVIGLLSWALAVLIGAAIRAGIEPAARFDPTFILVMFGVGAVVLVPWRTVLAIWVNRGAPS